MHQNMQPCCVRRKRLIRSDWADWKDGVVRGRDGGGGGGGGWANSFGLILLSQCECFTVISQHMAGSRSCCLRRSDWTQADRQTDTMVSRLVYFLQLRWGTSMRQQLCAYCFTPLIIVCVCVYIYVCSLTSLPHTCGPILLCVCVVFLFCFYILWNVLWWQMLNTLQNLRVKIRSACKCNC